MRKTRQLTTFYIGEDLYGIDVSWVQEVTGNLPIIPVPLAPPFVRGLINLRGQIATAIGLRQLFGLPSAAKHSSDMQGEMSVVCRFEGNLVSLLVDSIGDVMEVSEESFEAPPKTVPIAVRRFLAGVYKTDTELLSLVEISRVSAEISNAGTEMETKAV
jgi:purine-binding chemotaxis protein CheW